MQEERRVRDREVRALDEIAGTAADPSVKIIASTLAHALESMDDAIRKMSHHITEDEKEKERYIAVSIYKEKLAKRNQAFILFACGILTTALGYSWNQFVSFKERMARYEENQHIVLNKLNQMDNSTNAYRKQSDKTMDKIDKATE